MLLKQGDLVVWVRGPHKGTFGTVHHLSWDRRYAVIRADGSRMYIWANRAEMIIAEDDFEQWAIVERVKAGCYD